MKPAERCTLLTALLWKHIPCDPPTLDAHQRVSHTRLSILFPSLPLLQPVHDRPSAHPNLAGISILPSLSQSMHPPSTLLQVYIRECDWDKVMCKVTADDLDAGLRVRLQTEQVGKGRDR